MNIETPQDFRTMYTRELEECHARLYNLIVEYYHAADKGEDLEGFDDIVPLVRKVAEDIEELLDM